MQGYQDRVIDLHNDLLSYLASSPENSPHDTITGSSIGHIKDGSVACLGLAMFCETGRDSKKGLFSQHEAYSKLLQTHPSVFSVSCSPSTTQVVLAIENCSVFASEDEPLNDVFRRFDEILGTTMPLYASLTWNSENRFGGGAHAMAGLKKDGEALLDFFSTRVYSVDLSHASDALAQDVLRYLDETKSPLHVIASHSNFRAITDVPRNIPDEIAQEIVHRGGVIGLTCIKRFIGNSIEDYFKHIQHALKHNWQESIAIGADFFWHAASPRDIYPKFSEEHFFKGFENISSLKSLMRLVQKEFGIEVSQQVSWRNAFQKLIGPYTAGRSTQN